MKKKITSAKEFGEAAKEFGEANRKYLVQQPHEWLISKEVEDEIRRYITKPVALSIGFNEALKNQRKPSRKQRLRMRWRSLRYTVGHWIVGYECEDY